MLDQHYVYPKKMSTKEEYFIISEKNQIFNKTKVILGGGCYYFESEYLEKI